MKATSLVRRAAAIATSVAAMTLTTVLVPTAAHAADPEHYYIEIGGTGATPPAPHCTFSYDAANQALNLGPSAITVCYPATAGPVIGPTGGLLDNLPPHLDALTAPTYDASVQQGIQAALRQVKTTRQQHPDAEITITGYSQGAQVADDVLQQIANGTAGIPSSKIDGMLYADPEQPDTGLFAHLPKGLGIPGVATAEGPGPVEFNGIPVRRYCITGDPVCDLRSITNAPGYFTLHPRYMWRGNVIAQTLADDGKDGVQWRNADGGPGPA
ncbi:MAG: PE-PPE domain-containing protein [Streptomycetaceae bacterium]|nr:PE-PPE domain-containing protein [Streptomycetaceae bacterium]